MSDTWFDWQIAPDGDLEDGCHPQEAAALKEYIHSTTITPDLTARSITLPVIAEPETAREGQSSDNLVRLWGLIIDGLTDLPEHRSKIIHLLQAIQKLPTTIIQEPEAREKQIRWADLPGFAILWSDLNVSDGWRRSIREWAPEQRERVRQHFIKQATIEAQLLIAGISGVCIFWGLDCVCDALERADAVPEFEVPPTKEWLEIAGNRILEESDGEVTGHLEERDLWKQDKGLKPRWDFWKQRLQSMAESKELTLETKNAAKKAVEAMEAVAKQNVDGPN